MRVIFKKCVTQYYRFIDFVPFRTDIEICSVNTTVLSGE